MTTEAKSVLISGVSGYLGRALCRELFHLPWCERIDGFDLCQPLENHPKLSFRELDINSPSLAPWVAELQPDIVVHLAFVVDPLRDEERMRRVNVEGTGQLLAAAAAAAVPQVLVASSGTAYGAWPDNPVPLKESHPLRPAAYQYAAEKSEVEGLCETFAREHPEVALSVIRPCVVYGPMVCNYLADLLTKMPVVVALGGYDPPLQFVHEDDVARAIATILEQDARGAFNIAPPDRLKVSEVLAMTKKRSLLLPEGLLEPLASLCWRYGVDLLGAPPSFLDFMRYPWVLDSSRLTEELAFEFHYSTRDALVAMLRAKGVL